MTGTGPEVTGQIRLALRILRRLVRRKSTPAKPRNRRRSYPIGFPRDVGVNSLERAARGLGRSNRYKFDPPPILNRMQLLARPDPERFTNLRRNDDLVL